MSSSRFYRSNESQNVLKDRGKTTTVLCMIFVGTLAFSMLKWVCSEVEFRDIVLSFVVVNGALLTAEFLSRCCLLIEEVRHIGTRYRNDKFALVRRAFCCNTSTVWFAILTGFLFVIHSDNLSVVNIQSIDCRVHFAVLVYCSIMHSFLQTHQSLLTESIFLEQMEGIHYGSGMAYGFFYGYLNLILPNHGHGESKNLKERIEKFQREEELGSDSFPIKKLFILIPRSSYLPGNLKELAEDRMEALKKKQLDPVILNRAGVMGRNYGGTTVYRIKCDESKFGRKHIYAAVEGATPLLTLYNIYENAAARVRFSREHKEELIFVFYKTLFNILQNDARTRDFCHLIYYNDLDEYGNRVNVGDIVLSEIERLKFR